MRRVIWTGLLFLSVVIGGCTIGGHDNRPGSTDEVAKAPVPVASPEPVEPVVKGTVTYRERVAIPADAEVYVWIMDVTPNVMLAQVVLADTTVTPLGKQIPIPFELAYDPSKIAGDHDYGVRAVIKSGGNEMFVSREPTPVITKGKSNQVELVLGRSAP